MLVLNFFGFYTLLKVWSRDKHEVHSYWERGSYLWRHKDEVRSQRGSYLLARRDEVHSHWERCSRAEACRVAVWVGGSLEGVVVSGRDWDVVMRAKLGWSIQGPLDERSFLG